jgi:hypothetical protein
MIFWNNTGFTLDAFDPVAYILNGSHPKSSRLLSFRVYVPEDIPPDELSTKPAIDIRVSFPGWMEYTLESYRIEVNNAEIQPCRSFNLIEQRAVTLPKPNNSIANMILRENLRDLPLTPQLGQSKRPQQDQGPC